MEKTHDRESVMALYQQLGFMALAEGEAVFHYGDKGDRFYIILEGKVDVRTISPVELNGDAASPVGLISFVLSFYNDIYWAKVPNGDEVKALFTKELEKYTISVDDDGNFDNVKALNVLQPEVNSNRTKIHTKLHSLINPRERTSITLYWFKTVATLNAG